jgi:hypothetical protein
VTVVIVGLSAENFVKARLYDTDEFEKEFVRLTDNIGPYLVPGSNVAVRAATEAPDERGKMFRGNMPNDGGYLVLSSNEAEYILAGHPEASRYIRSFVGSKDFIRGLLRYCVWIEDKELEAALEIPKIEERIRNVRKVRAQGGQQAKANIDSPHRFVFAPHRNAVSMIVPRHFSENRRYITAGILDGRYQVVADSVISSRLHLVWMDAVAGRIKTDYRYSGTLVWNTFPVPTLTQQNKADLAECGQDILLAREAHFPSTISDLYAPDDMPDDLRRAHEKNDETLERIYIGRKFRNDTERLEKLFDLYTKMTAGQAKPKKGKAK